MRVGHERAYNGHEVNGYCLLYSVLSRDVSALGYPTNILLNFVPELKIAFSGWFRTWELFFFSYILDFCDTQVIVTKEVCHIHYPAPDEPVYLRN